jgi:hypothetical protein
VYLSVVVVLIAAMRHGATPRRVRELSGLIGADRRTIDRWQVFWREHLPQTQFWRIARGRLVPFIEIVALPQSLINAFLGTDPLENGWENLLRFLSPITINGGRLIAGLE